MRQVTNTEQATRELGKRLAPRLRGGDVVALYGELGAGKTTLVKGIAEGLGVKEDITSPTFTLMNIYEIPTTDYRPRATAEVRGTVVRRPSAVVQKLVHIDTYRLKDEGELIAIGAEDYLGEPGVITIVEWPEKISALLKNKTVINIYFKHGQTPEERLIKIENLV